MRKKLLILGCALMALTACGAKEQKAETVSETVEETESTVVETEEATEEESEETTEVTYEEGWSEEAEGWKYQLEDGTYLTNQWEEIDGKWYYFDEDGVMLADQWIDNTYYVGGDGAMLVDTETPDGYLVGTDGAWIRETIDYSKYYGKYTRSDNVAIGIASSIWLEIEKIEDNKVYGYVSCGAGTSSGEAWASLDGAKIKDGKFYAVVEKDDIIPPMSLDKLQAFTICFEFIEDGGMIDAQVQNDCIYPTFQWYSGVLVNIEPVVSVNELENNYDIVRDDVWKLISEHADAYYGDDGGFGLSKWEGDVEWIDCGSYYKVEDVQLFYWYDNGYMLETGVLQEFDELRIRKNGSYIFQKEDRESLSIEEWANRAAEIDIKLPRFDVTFDSEGYIVSFWDGYVM